MGQDPDHFSAGQEYQQEEQNSYQGGYQQSRSSYQQPHSERPGPGYRPYGQPGFSQASNTNQALGPSSINLAPNITAFLSYLAGWISGLIVLLLEKQNRFVRFHAMQSILISLAEFVLAWALNIILSLPIIGLLSPLVWTLYGIGTFVLWIFMMINAYQGRYYKLPFIGDYAERFIG
ncbi:MAG TPA: DUF4870 domain-containing protein [Ktedonobacteraceae bacterium]|nr:DUF4870 domain-containing protein [Ktedonobacteraceae bacterium]